MSDVAIDILPRPRPNQPALSSNELPPMPWLALALAARCVLRALPLLPWERVAVEGADGAEFLRYAERVALLAGLTAVRGAPLVEPMDQDHLGRAAAFPTQWTGSLFTAVQTLVPALSGGVDMAGVAATVSEAVVEAIAARVSGADDAFLDVAAGRADAVWLHRTEGDAGDSPAPVSFLASPFWQGVPTEPEGWQAVVEQWSKWVYGFASGAGDVVDRYHRLSAGEDLDVKGETEATLRWVEETIGPARKMAEQNQRPGTSKAGTTDLPYEESVDDDGAPPSFLDAPEFVTRLSPAAQFTLTRADQLRATLGQSEIHMEHLLGGLYAMSDGAAQEVLGRAGIDRAKLGELIREAVGVTLPTGTLPPRGDLDVVPPRSRHVREALMAAERMASEGGYRRIENRHLLAGALSVSTCSVIKALLAAGVDPAWVQLGRPRLGASRGPVLMAGFQSDDPEGQDRLNVRRDARALAAVIASHEVTPPLSVGLFGDWGTGKTFFMRLLEKEVKRLQERARSETGSPWCRNVVQLWFNAWHYMDTNLWASLASEIFDGLAVEVAKDQELVGGETDPEAARARLLADTLHLKQVKAEAERRRAAATRKLEASQNRLEELDQAGREVEAELTPRQLARAAFRAAVQDDDVRKSLQEVENKLGLPGLKTASAQARADLLELKGVTGSLKATWMALRDSSGRLTLVAAGAALIAVVLVVSANTGWVVDRVAPLAAKVVALATGLLALVGPWIERYSKVGRRAVDLFSAARKEHATTIRAKQDALKKQLMDERSAIDARVEAESRRIRETQTEIEALEKKIEGLSADGQMRDFLQARRGSEDYRRHLGVISRARNDFERLTELLKAVEAAERKRREEARAAAEQPASGKAVEPASGRAGAPDGAGSGRPLPRIDRIVLYIDDLDRCPESKVVDVLQAVHLLLAFPLFVVVVGVDSRWLLHSLQQHVGAFKKPGENGDMQDPDVERWRSTPLNYLEKIFQIPFTLRPMNADGFDLLVDDLTVHTDQPEAGATPPHGHGDGDRGGTGSAIRGTREGGTVPGGSGREGTGEAAGDGKAGDDATADKARAGAGPTPEHTLAGDEDSDDRSGAPSSEPGDRSDEPSGVVDGKASTPEDASQGEEDAGDAIRPELVRIESWERDFMKLLYPFIPTPRAAKRFVNVYRLIRASVAEERWARFLGDETGGEHRTVLLLLAMIVGYPAEAAELLRELVAGEHDERWVDFVERFRSSVEQRYSVEGTDTAPEPASAPWDDQEIEGTSSARRWADLFSRLDTVHRHIPANQSSEDYLRWAPEVARYSFQSGRALLHR